MGDFKEGGVTIWRGLVLLIAAAAMVVGCGAPPASPPAPSQLPAGTLPMVEPKTVSNQKPAYPEMAKRMGQQGKVILRVFIDTEGRPSQVLVHQSSGYPILDQAAVESASGWKYVPGRRNGVLEAMWFNVPITYSLN